MAEYKNPQQEPGGDKRMLMVFAVTFALIIIGQIFLFKKASPRRSRPRLRPRPRRAASPRNPRRRPRPHPHQARQARSCRCQARRSESRQQRSRNRRREQLLPHRLHQSRRRGQVWILKKYKDDDGKPLDLVNKAAKFGYPLSLYTYDDTLRNQINSALYVASASGNITAPGELTYEYASGDVTVRKSFVFGDTYVISIETLVTRNGQPVQAYPMWPAALGDEATGPAYASQKIEYMADGKVERIAPKKVSGGNTIRGPFNWAGPQDQFFAAMFLPDNPDTAVMITQHGSITVPKDPKNPDPNSVITTKCWALRSAITAASPGSGSSSDRRR